MGAVVNIMVIIVGVIALFRLEGFSTIIDFVVAVFDGDFLQFQFQYPIVVCFIFFICIVYVAKLGIGIIKWEEWVYRKTKVITMDDTIEEKGISKTEIKIITALGCFSVVWFFLIIPFLMGSEKFLLLNPVFQYISLNISLIFFIYLFFGYFLGMVINGGHRSVRKDLTRSLSVFVFSEFVINLFTAPYVVSRDTILYFESEALIGASVDGMLAWVLNQGLGVSSEAWLLGFSPLYMLLYVIIPMGITMVLLTVLSSKQSREMILF